MATEVKAGGTISFLESLPENIEQLRGGTVFALTAEAAVALAARDIAFRTCDDFFSLEDALSKESAYAELFNAWIDDVDARILRVSPGLKALNVRPARLYGYYLQLMIDSYLIRVLEIRAVFEALKPEAVVFIGPRQEEKPVDHQLAVKGCSLFSVVLPFVCKHYRISCRREEANGGLLPPVKQSRRALLYRSLRTWCGQLKKGIGNLRTLRSGSEAALVLFHGWGIDTLAADLKTKGVRCLNSPGKYRWTSEPAPKRTLEELGITTAAFDAFAGMKLEGLVRDRLQFFVDTVCPNLERAVPFYLDYFLREKVRFVLTTYKIRFDDFAVMAAACASSDVTSVQVIHGYSCFAIRFWKFSEQPCDLYLIFNEELMRYFRSTIFTESRTRVLLTDTWTGKYGGLSQARTSPGGRKTVLYIPTLSGNPWYRFDGYGYQDIWYLRYQSFLLRYFTTEKEFDFIYKSFPGSSAVSMFMKRQVKNAGGNVSYSGGDLISSLRSSDYAIVDIPTTPLYETVAAGIPTCCLYHRDFCVRESAKEFFGGILQPFSTCDEAAAAVARFLRDEPSRYVRSIPVHEPVTADSLFAAGKKA